MCQYIRLADQVTEITVDDERRVEISYCAGIVSGHTQDCAESGQRICFGVPVADLSGIVECGREYFQRTNPGAVGAQEAEKAFAEGYDPRSVSSLLCVLEAGKKVRAFGAQPCARSLFVRDCGQIQMSVSAVVPAIERGEEHSSQLRAEPVVVQEAVHSGFGFFR